MDRGSLSDVHRIVIKLGTHVVMRDGATLADDRLNNLVDSVARLRGEGREVVLVSSGAVGMGMRVLGLKERPRSLGLRQACAAVGQSHLMQLYTAAFAKRGLVAAQVLLTQEDLGDRDKALCVRTTLMRLLELGTVPVLNENDSVSVRELVEHNVRNGTAVSQTPIFGDNDGLSALVAVALDADLLVLLTNVDGFFTASPSVDPNAKRVSELSAIDEATLARALGSSSGGSGGMASKLEAARLAISEGTAAVIANGTVPNIVDRVLTGEDVGTFVRTPAQRPRRLRHIAVAGRKQGALVVNAGALTALVERKASLLPIGVVAVEGDFGAGDLVEIRDGSGRVHGRGLVNYDAVACRKLCGRHSDDIDALLGYRGYDALVTRDNLVMGSL
ncbi:MAG TPA: glutamate 5-kinase [Polyangia bacterium]